MHALDALRRGCFALACAALAAMLLAYLTEVLLRYAFNAPTRWSSDVVAYSMLVMVAMALPAITHAGGHVAITSLAERLPARWRSGLNRSLGWLAALSCWAATALLASQGFAQARGGIETVAALPVPKWWLSAAVAFGMALAGIEFARHALASRARSRRRTRILASRLRQ